MVRTPALLAWALHVLLVPFYVLPSGLPQPSDLLVLVVVPLAMLGWNGRLAIRSVRIVRVLTWFTLWVTVVNLGWAAVLGKWSEPKDYLIFPFFYIFDLGIFVAVLILFERYREVFIRITLYAVFAAVLFQVAASYVMPGSQLRGSLFFNNPNQLGYYVLLAATLVALTQRRVGLSMITASIALTGCAYLALISASRAAVGGIAMLLCLLLISNVRVIILACIAAFALVNAGGPIDHAIEASKQRAMQGPNPNRGDFLEERGYDRMWDYKEYMVLGAGEGDNVRFTTDPRKAHELHSSFATVLFSYGIPGAVMFVMLVFGILRGASARGAVMLAPTTVYMFAHQGLRFTFFWVILAIFVELQDPKRLPTMRARNAPAPG
ncbi:MAG: hypothetical protein ACM31C_22790 [Acidobacteriota bacterium]